MDIVTIISQVAYFVAILAFGYILGASVAMANLKKRLKDIGVDKEFVEQLMGKKQKE